MSGVKKRCFLSLFLLLPALLDAPSDHGPLLGCLGGGLLHGLLLFLLLLLELEVVLVLEKRENIILFQRNKNLR